MTSIESADQASKKAAGGATSPFADFLSILVRPRRTMRRILEQRRDRAVIPLVLLATLSGFAGDFRLADLRATPVGTFSVPVVLIIVLVILLVTLCAFLFFYFLAWIAVPIGHFLEGEGETRDVRLALAWGLAPLIAALFYRLPAMFLRPGTMGAGRTRVRLGDETLFVGASVPGDVWLWALVFAILEIGTLLWLVLVASSALAEAHRFSRARGLATLTLALISPLIVIISAVLAFR